MENNPNKILTIAATIFLFFALVNGLPYGYFTLLRFVVTIDMVYLAYNAYEKNNGSSFVYVFGALAILFNPIIPVYLNRELWNCIDIIIGIFLTVTLFRGNKK